MDYPEEVQALAKKCDAGHMSDIDAAVKRWLRAVVNLDGFEEWYMALVETAGRAMIHDCRHTRNTAEKNKRREYGPAAIVKPGVDTRAMFLESVWNIAVDGRRLGDITFSELPAIIADQRAKATGILWNVTLCARLLAIKPTRVNDDTTLQSGLKESAVRKLFDDLGEGETCREAESKSAPVKSSNGRKSKAKRTVASAARRAGK